MTRDASTAPAVARRDLLVFGAVMLAALVVRGAISAWQEALRTDPDAYRAIAENLLRFGVFGEADAPSAFRPPLYPLLLAACGSNFEVPPQRVAWLHLILGLATVAVVYEMARDSGHGRWRWAAPLGVALDPILIRQSTLVMTETTATLLFVVAWRQLHFLSTAPTWRRAGLTGLSLGLAVLCRPTFLPWALAALGWLLWRAPYLRKQPGDSPAGPRRVRWFAVAALATLALTLTPWTVRNYVRLGAPIVTTTHGGYTLFLANNPEFYCYLQHDTSGVAWSPRERLLLPQEPSSARCQPCEAAIWDAVEREREAWTRGRQLFDWPLPHKALTGERLADFAYRDSALLLIRTQPRMFLTSAVVRIWYLWSPLPQKITANEPASRTYQRYAVAAWYSAIYVLALIGLWRVRREILRSPWVWGLLFCLVLTAVHSVYWSNLRMRAPAMPVIYLLAGAALASAQWRMFAPRPISPP